MAHSASSPTPPSPKWDLSNEDNTASLFNRKSTMDGDVDGNSASLLRDSGFIEREVVGLVISGSRGDGGKEAAVKYAESSVRGDIACFPAILLSMDFGA